MEAENNELKIELYPDRQPRYDFPKEPLENIIPKDALGYSFDKKEKLAFIKYNTLFNILSIKIFFSNHHLLFYYLLFEIH